MTQNYTNSVCVYVCVCTLTKSHPTLYNSMHCSLPGSSDYGILQGRILEWIAISLIRGFSQPRDRTQDSSIAGGFFTTEPPGKPQ